jgi:hypothetical protein
MKDSKEMWLLFLMQSHLCEHPTSPPTYYGVFDFICFWLPHEAIKWHYVMFFAFFSVPLFTLFIFSASSLFGVAKYKM